MARLTAAQRAANGAKFLDKNWPRSEHGPWFWAEGMENPDLKTALGKIFSWARRLGPERNHLPHSDNQPGLYTLRLGMADKVAEELGFVTPHFDGDSEEEHQKKRNLFAGHLYIAWKQEIRSRREKIPHTQSEKKMSRQKIGTSSVLV